MSLLKHSKLMASILAASLLLSVAGCGSNGGDGSKASQAKTDDRLAAATTAFNEYAPDLMKNATGDMVVSDENWKDSPSFDDIVAVSVMGGMEPYQGAATDPLTVVSQPIMIDDASWNVESTLKAALNDKGEVVLLWDEWKQNFPDVEGREPIISNMAVSWDLASMLMRLNDVRMENGLAPMAADAGNDGVASPDADNVPSQNSNVGDPSNMTEEEQQAYASTQENIEIIEEQADSQE